jgi:hypothetical protein
MNLNDMQLASSYVPIQQWEAIYPPAVALTRGTIFPSLDMPLGSYPFASPVNFEGGAVV